MVDHRGKVGLIIKEPLDLNRRWAIDKDLAVNWHLAMSRQYIENNVK